MQPLTILIVEDYEPFRRFVCSALEKRAEFQVIGEASDGLEAVQKAEEFQPDLVLADIGLPKLDGFGAARQIRSVAPRAKLLFVSQESASEIVREAFRLGAQAYVHKQRASMDLLPAVEAVRGGKIFVSEGLEFRKSADGQASHRHEIVFCSNEETLLKEVVSFLTFALCSGNPAIGRFTWRHWELILQELRAKDIHIDAAIQQGAFISLDADKALTQSQILETIKCATEAAVKAGKDGPRVAFCGEYAGRLWAEGKADQAIRLEQFCSVLAKDNGVDVLCVYPSCDGKEDDQALKSICAEHTALCFR
jgi:DNA-binding NarL/FixJ family response regulator